ncbi:hypothetical protein C0585_03075 [Candidatus Woesearchaeota archaeon]|nr:MAG: hypothetical protein C0585_03075 [Candidatus Woesearchaeota archaeon]
MEDKLAPSAFDINPLLEGIIKLNDKEVANVKIFPNGLIGKDISVSIIEGYNKYEGLLHTSNGKLNIISDEPNIKYVLKLSLDNNRGLMYEGNRIEERDEISIKTFSNYAKLYPSEKFIH